MPVRLVYYSVNCCTFCNFIIQELRLITTTCSSICLWLSLICCGTHKQENLGVIFTITQWLRSMPKEENFENRDIPRNRYPYNQVESMQLLEYSYLTNSMFKLTNFSAFTEIPYIWVHITLHTIQLRDK